MSILGIDVSHHQDSINWNRVKRDSVRFAFLKASEGITYKDGKFLENFKEAWKEKIHIAPYHFVKPLQDSGKQIGNFIDCMMETNRAFNSLLLSPVLDFEWDLNSNKKDRWLSLGKQQRIDKFWELINILENRVLRKPIIYTSQSFFEQTFGVNLDLSAYALWTADYNISRKEPRIPKGFENWTFWQYTDRGKIDGISSKVDLSRYNESCGMFTKLKQEI